VTRAAQRCMHSRRRCWVSPGGTASVRAPQSGVGVSYVRWFYLVWLPVQMSAAGHHARVACGPTHWGRSSFRMAQNCVLASVMGLLLRCIVYVGEIAGCHAIVSRWVNVYACSVYTLPGCSCPALVSCGSVACDGGLGSEVVSDPSQRPLKKSMSTRVTSAACLPSPVFANAQQFQIRKPAFAAHARCCPTLLCSCTHASHPLSTWQIRWNPSACVDHARLALLSPHAPAQAACPDLSPCLGTLLACAAL
jgi:hypothetical protein